MKKLIAILLLSALLLVGCNTKKDDKNQNLPGGDLPPEESEIASSDDEANQKATNPFTGVEVVDPQTLLNRPLAVMINNIEPALPQSGLSAADVIFELPVEGSSTRLMAVYADNTTMPTMGSIRSSRHDYVELIKPFDPLYLHFGYSDAAKNTIEKEGIDSINGIQIANVAFYQDKEKLKVKASEHTWFSNYDYLKGGIANKSYKDKLDAPIEPMFLFAKDSAMAQYSDAVVVNSATIKYSGGANAGFEYNAESKLYKKSQNGKPHLDENIGQAVEVKNILVMYTNVGLLPNGKNKDIDLSKGTGYYLSEGKKIDCTFRKDSVDSYLKAYDQKGQEIAINKGNTWVCIAPNETKDQAVFA